MSLTSSFDLLSRHSPPFSIHVYMKHLSGPNIISKIHNSPPPIISWTQTQLSLIFTFRKDSYATWAISMFLQASVQILFWNPTTVGWQDILVWRKLWSFFRNIFIGQNFDRTSTSILDLSLPVPFPSQQLRRKDYTPLFIFQRSIGNPSQRITCLACHPPSKEMTVYLWSLIGFQR
jgi:hypothetical protein